MRNGRLTRGAGLRSENFPDRQRVRDIYVTGPEAECYREALALREPGESINTVEWMATHLFLDYLKSDEPSELRRLVEGEGGENGI